MNKQNSSKLVKDIIPASSSPVACNQSLADSCPTKRDKLSVVKGFTLLEVMIVTTILATLATTTVVALNPVELLAQMRDSQRITTIGILRDAVSLLVADRPVTNLGDTNLVYISLPSNNSNCTDIVGLPALPAGQTYHCVTADRLTRIDGGGWIPLDFRGITDGSPFTVLPIDVTNTPTLFYSYIPSAGGRVTLTARIESIRQRTIHPTGLFTTHFTATVDRPPLGTGQVVVPLGSASAPSYTFIGDLNTGIWSPGADTIGLSTAGTLRMSIDNMGNVGIGTPTPGNRLTVAGIIHSTTGGFMFPDGTIQVTAGGGTGGGEALAPGTLAGQTLRWTGTTWVANNNLFNTGTSVGIGTTSPVAPLDIAGGNGVWFRSAATAGNLGGTAGRGMLVGYASSLDAGYLFAFDYATGTPKNIILNSPGGNVGIGTTNPLSRVVIQGHGTTTAGTLNVTASDGTSRFFVRDDGNVGIGTTTPTTRLDIEGQIRIRGGSPAAGRVLTADATGLATWAVPTGGLPTGTASQTLRHDGTTWVANNNLFNTGTSVGIGTTTPRQRLDVAGAVVSGIGHFVSGISTGHLVLNAGTSGSIFFRRAGSAPGDGLTAPFTDLMSISNDGNVGIGTTSPGTNLHVFSPDGHGLIRVQGGAGQGGVQIVSSGTSSPFINFGTGGVVGNMGAIFADGATGNMQFRTADNVNRLIITNTTGNVGVGTTAPGSRVVIQGHGTTTAGALNVTASDGASRFFVRDDGNVGIGTTTPTSPLHVMNLPIFANNVVALERGLTAGAIYRTKAGALMVASPTSYFLFSSETTHNGNLGGRVGANNICRTSATRPAVCSAHNTWAFISISYADEIRDFPSTMPAWTGGSAFNPLYAWYWRNGTHAGILAANSWAGLMDRSILNSGMAGGIPNEIHWTGSSGEGLWADNNCMNWTMASMLMGVVGNPGLVNMGGWLDDGFSSCGTRRRIYCACF